MACPLLGIPLPNVLFILFLNLVIFIDDIPKLGEPLQEYIYLSSTRALLKVKLVFLFRCMIFDSLHGMFKTLTNCHHPRYVPIFDFLSKIIS